MHILDPRHLKQTTSIGVLCVFAAGFAGCGDDDKPAPETFDLDKIDASADAIADTVDAGKVFNFEDDTSDTAVDQTQPSDTASGQTDAATGDETIGADSGNTDATGSGDDAAAIDTGPQQTNSCKGKCGLFLDNNPCHCNVGCESEDGGCCGDYQLVCSCTAEKDCDDANACTTDSCNAGKCKQIPFQNCCQSDAECSGSTTCKIAKCQLGTCGLANKDCDDGIACTVDLCDDKTGECSSALPPTKCLIDGFCADKDDAKPGSSGCELCQPQIDAKHWTAKAGACLIDDKCHAKDDAHPTDKCLVCAPENKADAWSVKAGHCFVDATCYVSGQKPVGGGDCASCKPSVSQDKWSGEPNTCAITTANGIECKKAGDKSPTGSCASCDPTKSTAGYTVSTGWCLIDALCVQDGNAGDGANVCKACNVKTSTTAWTDKATGAVCDDNNPCTDATLCNDKGACIGKTDPLCCQSNDDCKNLEIPSSPCEVGVCLKGSGKCELHKLGPDKCCTSGKCCDIANKVPRPAGTQCSESAAGYEYRCNENNEEKRELYYGCTGNHPSKCGPNDLAAGPWKPGKKCGADAVCTLTSKTIAPSCKAK